MRKRYYKVLILLLASIVVTPVWATPIDLNDFFADPSVTVAADGSSAILTEDPLFTSVLLANDPGLGDPEVIIAGANVSLLFDFQFLEPPGNDDIFIAMILDAASGLSVGAGFEFMTDSSSSGSVAFDLSSLLGQTLGLQFELGSNLADADTTSELVISNLRLETRVAAAEPNVLLLFVLGLLVLMMIKFKEIK